ncbi:hypothetical protein C9374_009088 [Naegleria lovaniensis]|uniref:Ubiquitin-like domain-containing protein n=1 Tax=Naegleria lovaniensis TaxID=51637 RepID=A0AA88GDS5_NAELO|nr:uncharacterized protein C9374_009088 [Naegleria lovaniensis]KAG2377572.1 hypothetical protein C9374_009088 [Naegleria lovaniensis]
MSQIPLHKIVLYNNGLCSFERRTTDPIRGDQELTLFFKNSNDKDITKSISFSTIPVSSSGDSNNKSSVSSVSYQNTVEKTDQLNISIPQHDPLTGMLRELKGASITLAFHGGSSDVSGVLLGVEDLMDPLTKVSVPSVALYTKTCTIQNFILSNIAGIKFNDPNIQADVQHSLESYISQRNKDLFKLTVFTKGENDYLVQANYDLMSQPWSPTYRFKFQHVPNTTSSDISCTDQYTKGMLDCLAIIKNDQEEDYSNVQLILVTGSPPLSSNSLATSGSLNISIVNAKSGSTFSMQVNPSTLVDEVKRRIQLSQNMSYSRIKLFFAGKSLEEGRMMSDYNIQNESRIHLKEESSSETEDSSSDGTRSSGDSNSLKSFRMADSSNLSFFPIEYPITVKRNQQAMISFLKKQVDVKKVLLFNESIKTGNPLNAVMFQNTTGFVLEPGSIIFRDENENVVGESALNQMWNQDEALLPISLQLAIEVKKDFNTSQTEYHQIMIKNGSISLYKYKKQTASYDFDNKSPYKYEEVFVDHMFVDGWDLESTEGFTNAEPVDVTDRYYRFSGQLLANEKKKFLVTEKAIKVDTIDLTSISSEVLQKHSKYIQDPSVLQALRESIELRQEADSIMSRIYKTESDIREVKDDQQRIRSNIEVVKSNNQQQMKYITELSRKDDELVELYNLKKKLEEEKNNINKKQKQVVMSIAYNADIVLEEKK